MAVIDYEVGADRVFVDKNIEFVASIGDRILIGRRKTINEGNPPPT